MHIVVFLAATMAFGFSQVLFFIAIASHRAAPRRRKTDFAIYLALIVAAACNLVLYAAHLGVYIAARLNGVELWKHVTTVLS